MSTNSVISFSTTYPMSDASKSDSYRNDSSPPTSLISLESTDPFENSLSADTFLESESGSQGLSPAGSIHSSLYPDNLVSFQEYLMLDLFAYGLPTTEPDVAAKPTQMLPYPSITPLITLGTGEEQAQTLDETHQADVQEALNGLSQTAPDTYFHQAQAIKEWSGACSTALSTESAPSPNSSLPQEAHYMSTVTSIDYPSSQTPASSSNDWSTKNKLNLTVNTNMTAFKAADQLSPNCQNPLTPYSESSASYISASAPSLYFEPQHSGLVSPLVPSPPSIVNWLHASLDAPQSNPGVSYCEGLPTPSSATFSAVPTPTGISFPSDYPHPLGKENSAMGINPAQTKFSLQLPVQSSGLLSPTNMDLTSGLGYQPVSASAPQVPHRQYQSNVYQLVNSPASYSSPLYSPTDYFTGLPQAPPNNYSSKFDHASTFGHMVSEPGFCAPLEKGPCSVPLALASPEDLDRSEQGKRALSQHTDSEDEHRPSKRRCSATSCDSANENVNPYQASGGVSSLLKRAPLVGSRLKPGPKSKSTLVQHPPPGANAIGLNPSGEACGIPKHVLKGLYDEISSPSKSGDHSSSKRFVCKLDDCRRSFARKTAIESHLQTHLEDKPFVCSTINCNAAFVRQHDLRRHEQIHLKNKAHNCICGKGFARGDALMRHRQRGICAGSLCESGPGKNTS
ncbi:hypothetical protein PGTUg99_032896 [Puccinia graminis f. sp. tritici]|uniref:C2H2-type domain-containing protein n=1 Tax=Puccinia graminis f. sp. tritici TaxID=56615 RepID=A0A5B0MDI2_PUCGR|nr:hypothetical protein PGTUg99_032896 [Puccinia graminis f. sp. tritici]